MPCRTKLMHVGGIDLGEFRELGGTGIASVHAPFVGRFLFADFSHGPRGHTRGKPERDSSSPRGTPCAAERREQPLRTRGSRGNSRKAHTENLRGNHRPRPFWVNAQE